MTCMLHLLPDCCSGLHACQLTNACGPPSTPVLRGTVLYACSVACTPSISGPFLLHVVLPYRVIQMLHSLSTSHMYNVRVPPSFPLNARLQSACLHLGNRAPSRDRVWGPSPPPSSAQGRWPSSPRPRPVVASPSNGPTDPQNGQE